MNEHSQLQVLIAKQIRPLAEQLGYLPRVQPKGRNNGKLSACKRALTNNTEFSLAWTYEHLMSFGILWVHNSPESNQTRLFPGLLLLATLCHHQMLVVGPELLAALSAWPWWPQSYWCDMRSKKVHRNLHCLLLDKHQKNKIHFIWRYLNIPDAIYPNTLHFSRPLLPITHCQTSKNNLIYSIALHNIWGARHLGISRTRILTTTSVSCPIPSDS